jgi:hypothetical protein
MKKILTIVLLVCATPAVAAEQLEELPFKNGLFGLRSTNNAKYLTCLGERMHIAIDNGELTEPNIMQYKKDCIEEVDLEDYRSSNRYDTRVR